MYQLAVKEKLDKKFKKLQRKDTEMLRLIEKKVEEPGKPLPLQTVKSAVAELA